jgi:hypothetical protein
LGRNSFGQLKIVDVVPSSQNTETSQNSEPNIAVNPANPSQVLISAFGRKTSNPVFLSTDDGSSWSDFLDILTLDTSLAWSGTGTAYLAQLASSDQSLIVKKSTNPGNGITFSDTGTSYAGKPDQPWVVANNIGGSDHIYVGFNDLNQAGKTASIRRSTNGGTSFTNTVIEKSAPGLGQDGPAVRVALSGSNVFAAFQRWDSLTAANDAFGSVVVVKDTNSGGNGFTNLNVTAATSQTFPRGDLGSERLGSDLSIAVDPGNANRLFLAYGLLSGSLPAVRVLTSTNGGVNWSPAFTTATNTGLPALAIAQNGAVGLLYTRFGSGNLETHFLQTADGFDTISDLTLSSFTDGDPAPAFDPYIGDYQDLEAVGNNFYGAFSASNNTSQFPIQPTFVRDKSMLGNSVSYSIDPFFFSTQAVPEPATLTLAALGAWLCRRRRHRG